MIITLTCVNININNIIFVIACRYVTVRVCIHVCVYVSSACLCLRTCPRCTYIFCSIHRMYVCVSMDAPRSDKAPSTQRWGLPPPLPVVPRFVSVLILFWGSSIVFFVVFFSIFIRSLARQIDHPPDRSAPSIGPVHHVAALVSRARCDLSRKMRNPPADYCCDRKSSPSGDLGSR